MSENETVTEYVARRGITVETLRDKGMQIEDGWEHHAYQLRLHLAGTDRTLDTPWKQGMGIEESPVDRPADVLDSVLSDERMGAEYDQFEDFAESLGYDTDSLSAFRIWEQLRAGALLGRVAEFVGGAEEFDYLTSSVEGL